MGRIDPVASLPLLGVDRGPVLKGPKARPASIAFFDLPVGSRAILSMLALREPARGALRRVRSSVVPVGFPADGRGATSMGGQLGILGMHHGLCPGSALPRGP
eukprot:141942-Heterocapsa_arctica.AAC.1